MNTFHVGLTVLVVLLIGCRKGAPHLTEPTSEGKGTFSCLVDGEPWSPVGNYSYDLATADVLRDRISIRAAGETKYMPGDFHFVIDTPWTYSSGPQKLGYVSYTDTTGEYIAIEDEIEFILTRFDSTARIIAGTFHFNARHSSGRLVAITQGRFDLIL